MTGEPVQEYEEYTVVWDGALEQTVEAANGVILQSSYGQDEEAGTLVQAWLDEIETAADSDSVRVEVFCLAHPHAPGIECECAQYASDHHPEYTFGGDDED